MKHIAVILAGGSGKRFWPLSTPAMPKQFIKLFEKPLANMTIERLAGVVDSKDIYIITTESLKDVAVEVTGLPESNVLAEPIGRNTAPAIAFVTYIIMKQVGDCVISVLPSDHFINDSRAFAKQVDLSFSYAENENKIVTLGIKPTEPNVNYGYIEKGAQIKNALFKVNSFMEKPDASTAEEYIKTGNYFWNAGMFVFKASVFLDELEKYASEIAQKLDKLYELYVQDKKNELKELYLTLPNISIDYAVMQKTAAASVVPAEFDWSDVGTFTALHAILAKNRKNNNYSLAPAIMADSTGNLIYTKKKKNVLIDVNDLIIVETDDALLIMKKGSDHKIKEINR